MEETESLLSTCCSIDRPLNLPQYPSSNNYFSQYPRRKYIINNWGLMKKNYFGLTAENFIDASNQLIEHLKQLINLCFHFCHIPNLLKIGTLFPVFLKKGDIKNSRNYRGITITPTYSKIIEKIIKERKKSKILLSQNPLQKGFTENSTPLLCELFIEELERESKDSRPVYIATYPEIDGTFLINIHHI